jgi:hypothetical protein
MMLFDRKAANELFDKTGIAREVPQALMEGVSSSSFENVRKVVGFMFNRVELGNRKHAFIAGYLKAKDAGMTEAAAMKEGIKTVHATQFRYGKLGTAEMMRGPAGRVVFQFSSYTLKQAQFLYDLLKKNPKAFMKYVGYAAGINYTMQELFDTDISNAVGFGINMGEAFNVVKSVASGDNRGAYRHLRQTVQSGGGLLPSGLGPAAMSAIKVGMKIPEGKGTEQLRKELMPVIGSRLKQAYLAVQNEEGGEYPIYNGEGHPMYRLDARQLAQRTFGPKTEKERVEGVKYEEARNLEQERKEVTDDVINLFADVMKQDEATAEKSIEKAVDLMIEYGIEMNADALTAEIVNRLLTREEQGKFTKKEQYQIQREGELVSEKDRSGLRLFKENRDLLN